MVTILMAGNTLFMIFFQSIENKMEMLQESHTVITLLLLSTENKSIILLIEPASNSF